MSALYSITGRRTGGLRDHETPNTDAKLEIWGSDVPDTLWVQVTENPAYAAAFLDLRGRGAIALTRAQVSELIEDLIAAIK